MINSRDPEVAQFIVENTARWCGNILVELFRNYGECLPYKTREWLRDICNSLHSRPPVGD